MEVAETTTKSQSILAYFADNHSKCGLWVSQQDFPISLDYHCLSCPRDRFAFRNVVPSFCLLPPNPK